MRLYLISTVLLLTAACFADVLNVPSEEYPSIQQAINLAINGDTIIVAPGRYFENINFRGKTITIRSTDPNDPNIVAATIIDGNSPADINFASVVTFKTGETNTSVLEGFTITGGTGSWLKVYWEFKGYLWNRCGGGIVCVNSSPTIRKNVITNNIAGQGGGIYCYNHSNAIITDNIISDNNAFINHGYSDPDANDPNVYDHGDGGAIVGFQYSDLIVKNNIIRHNHADLYGGGIHFRQWSDGLIENNLITQNWSTLGAGVHITYTSAPTIRKNTITENTAGPGGGGGIYLYYHSHALVEQNLITQNYCVNGAGVAVYFSSQPVIRNNLIINNISGAGIRVRGSSNPTIIFNTIGKNSANINSGGIDCTENANPIIINNIIFSNGPGFGIYADSLSHPETRYNNLWANEAGNYSPLIGDLTGINGNISAEPAFINSDSNDYHLNYFSPCINEGDPNTNTTDINDFDGQNRKMGQFADIGAYEAKPVWNITKNKQYDNIQAAINDANNNQTIVLIIGAHTGTGNKNVDFNGKAVTVQSINPNDLTVIQSTIIDCENNGRAFQFHSNEDANSVITGLTITSGGGYYEGTIYSYGSSPTIKNCIIKNSFMQNDGGAIYCGHNSSATIANCIIAGNASAYRGGGLYASRSNPTFVNCTIIGNKGLEGGGICSFSRSNPLVANCIVRNNIAADGNQLALISTLRDSSEEEITEMTVSNSNVQQGQAGVCIDPNMILHWQSGNIDSEPNFVDLGCWNDANTPLDANDDYYIVGNYHLLPGSVCINKGDNNAVPVQSVTDIDSEPRIFDGTVDMGADEFVTNAADFNNDGIVDFADAFVYSQYWLENVGDLPADFVDDDFIDFADFAEFADEWMWTAGWR